jgi:hypothetical protein
MDFSNDEAVLAKDGGFGILFGVMRDCAYRIRRHAEQEGRKAKRSWLHTNTTLVIITAALLSIIFTPPVSATTVILSADATETLGGLSFADGALAEYNPTTDTATLFFDENLFSGNTNIVAVHVLDNGNIILSTDGSDTLGGLSFNAGDLVEYNPTTDTAILFFDETLFFGGSENIDAVHILDSGNIILSSADDATLGGLAFGGGDLVEYNPITDTATLFFDGSLFGGPENIDAAYILDNGNIILSTDSGGGSTLGGLTFSDGDLVEYNPATDVAILYFSEGLFSNNADIDAVYVTTAPEPATIVLLGLGMLIFTVRR